jgi:hypothetical protein
MELLLLILLSVGDVIATGVAAVVDVNGRGRKRGRPIKVPNWVICVLAGLGVAILLFAIWQLFGIVVCLIAMGVIAVAAPIYTRFRWKPDNPWDSNNEPRP